MRDSNPKQTFKKFDTVSSTSPVETGPAIIVRSLFVFVRELVRFVKGGELAAAMFLVLLAAATEGVGLALLVPLVQALGDRGATIGRLGAAVQRALGAIGLPVSLLPLLAIFIGLIALRAVVLTARDITLTRLRLEFIDGLRRRVYRAIADASWSFLMRQRLAEILEVLTTQIERISGGTYFSLQLPAMIVLATVQVAIAIAISPLLTIGVLGWGMMLFLVLQWQCGDRLEQGVALDDAHRATFIEITDFLHALKLAKSHSAELRHVAAFELALECQTNETMAFDRRAATMRMVVQISAAVTLGAFVYFAVTFGQVNLAALFVMVIIFSRLAPMISQFQQGWQGLVQMLPPFARVIELQNLSAAAAESLPPGSERVSLQQDIRLSGVSFCYDKENGPAAIEALDLVIPAGSTIAIVGRTGAGKSTLADLLLGLLPPDNGIVLVDGTPLCGAVLARWRRSVGYVPQDNFLFNDTIRANLLWAYPEACEDDFREALAIAAADEFIVNLPKGLDTVVGERGLRLSGGERQRLGLARALLCRPALLILDEATSALDNETERVVQRAIEQLHGRMTIVLIAHRLSTVRGADRIIVLDHGRLIQSGTWDSLVGDRQGRFAAFLGEEEYEALPSAQSQDINAAPVGGSGEPPRKVAEAEDRETAIAPAAAGAPNPRG
jgi:ATP-binding cassette subfamily C protein